MYQEILKELIENGKSSDKLPCVSILLSLEQTLPGRAQNSVSLKETINTVKDRLRADYKLVTLQPILDELEQISGRIDFKHRQKGLGIFVGSNFSKEVDFPFEIKNKIVIDKSFATRDLVYAIQYMTSYWVMNLNTKNVRLFRAHGNVLNEVLDDNFPIKYEEQYQYPAHQKPQISGDYQSEETQIKDERRKQFFRHINNIAHPYFQKEPLPIALLGVKDVHGIFSPIFIHDQRVVSRIYGDFHTLSTGQISKKVWNEMQSYSYSSGNEIITDIRESIGKRGYLYGIEAVWRIAKEGRADLLVVEKDFEIFAYTNPETNMLFFNLSDTTGLTEKVDVVEDVIEMIREKKGEIVFTANGKLKDYDHIAVKTRY